MKNEPNNGMNTEDMKKLDKANASIIVPAQNYDTRTDRRLLIPYLKGNKIGFVNRQGEIVVDPKFDAIQGDCYYENDFIRVAVNYNFYRTYKKDCPTLYSNTKWGLINHKGELVLETEYSGVSAYTLAFYGNCFVIRGAYGIDDDGTSALINSEKEVIIPFGSYKKIEPYDFGLAKVTSRDGEVGIIRISGNEILVPFGKYEWIDGFEHGLARVRSHGKTTYTKNIEAIFDHDNDEIIQGSIAIEQHVHKEFEEHPERFAKWGIINEEGQEVLPVIYDEVWKFYGTRRWITKAVKDGMEFEIRLNDLLWPEYSSYDDYDYEDDYGTHYGEYAGTYAQDVVGFSDEEINDAFDGDPDAYWNID